MFEGYYGRRRLKTTIALSLAITIVLLLSKQNKGKNLGLIIETLPKQQETVSHASIRPHVKLRGALSAIQFIHSPYLSLPKDPTKFVPIIVLSKASNIEVRDAIRRTWGFNRSYRNGTLEVRIYFIVGVDDFTKHRIHMEQNVFDDVIQVTIPDMYTFSAYKELSALVWVRNFLPHLPFYIKTDDDVIINMRVFIDSFLPIIEAVSSQKVVVGWFGTEHYVQRGTYQKFIDAILSPSADELNYAMNLLYGITAKGADCMIETLSYVQLIEYPGDPFVTGILRDAAQVEITNMGESIANLKYEIANGACKAAFERSPQLLLCTSSLHAGSTSSMPEYFDSWNFLIGLK